MSTLILEKDPSAIHLTIADEKLIVDLVDGRSIVIPLEWYPRLQYGSPKERENWRLLGGGHAIEWPDLDEHIGVEDLIAGRRSGESKKSLQNWLESRKSK